MVHVISLSANILVRVGATRPVGFLYIQDVTVHSQILHSPVAAIIFTDAFEICRPGACGANLPAHARAPFASGFFTFAHTRSRSRQMRAELSRQGRSRAEVLIGLLEPALRYASRFEPEHELHVCCARDTAVTRGARYACPRRVPDWHWSCVWQASSEW